MEKDNKSFLIDKKFDYVVCMCMGVSYSDIAQEVANGATTFKELYDKLGVGAGCGSCKQEVQAILKKELERLEK
ncbi:bacterioferritin-associated ferredoxin [Candidatus Dependentiae bacterium]